MFGVGSACGCLLPRKLPPCEPHFSPMAFLKKFLSPHIWRRIFKERLTEPLHVNLAAIPVALFGTFRAKVAFDLVLRPHNAWGILKAADIAKERGIKEIYALEFGVATGAGLMNMAKIAEKVTEITGVKIRVVGFDTGKGMPPPRDYRDHPDLYFTGDFAMDVDRLKAILPPHAELRIGEVGVTVPEFIKSLTPEIPIGYAVIDVDYYYSSVEAMQVFEGPPECYLPMTVLYLDDIMLDEHTWAAGELLAVAEYNQRHAPHRHVARPEFLPFDRLFHHAHWIPHMFYLHVLDHPNRAVSKKLEAPRQLDNPYL